MEQYARVLRTLPDRRAELLVLRSAACGSCEGCSGCAHTPQRLTVTAENPVDAAPGERVLLESRSKTVLLLAMAVYLLPLVFGFAGYALGGALGISAPLCALAGFALAAVPTVLLDRRLRNRQSVRYTIVRRTGESECSVM